ncbi:hypothetical protein MUO83_02770 [Candidatus Bathyarchaeota archaeon]|nr:hypothetical protein [Candidatus Bathyarchaeota archaeon]
MPKQGTIKPQGSNVGFDLSDPTTTIHKTPVVHTVDFAKFYRKKAV